MGILNVTPDSFSDGGSYVDVPKAVDRGLEMVEEGVDLVDIGGESTRPNAADVDVAEELRRVVPVVEALAAQSSIPLSIDTRKVRVAREAVQAGAVIINDVEANRQDPSMWEWVAESGAGYVAMHMPCVQNAAIMDRVWPVIANPEVLAVNRQWDGHPGTLADQDKDNAGGAWQVWAKPQGNGATAVLLLNTHAAPQDLSLRLSNYVSTAGSGASVRDLWARKDLGTRSKGTLRFPAVDSHDSVFLLLTPAAADEQ